MESNRRAGFCTAQARNKNTEKLWKILRLNNNVSALKKNVHFQLFLLFFSLFNFSA